MKNLKIGMKVKVPTFGNKYRVATIVAFAGDGSVEVDDGEVFYIEDCEIA